MSAGAKALSLTPPPDPRAAEILAFWLADSLRGPGAARARHAFWYRPAPTVDGEIRRRFGPLVSRAIDGSLNHWTTRASGALALVIVLDQFTRNIFRGTPSAYDGDTRAWQVADEATRQRRHLQLPPVGSLFLLHPFHHSESPDQQARGVQLLREVAAAAEPQWASYLQRCIAGFSKHRAIVDRFGRFPHRNRTLGRSCTPEESDFLRDGAPTYGQ